MTVTMLFLFSIVALVTVVMLKFKDGVEYCLIRRYLIPMLDARCSMPTKLSK